MITIHLEKCRFYAHHGLHTEERVLGTTFEVSISLSLEDPGKIQSIQQTVNYVDIYDIVKKHMAHPRALLETVASSICDDIYSFDNRIKTIDISIRKLNPPIEGFEGSVSISMNKAF
jgi:dihydroneopterin aldolase